jgi:hypothetical protein
LGKGNLLDVCEAALALTLLVVGGGLMRQSLKGNRLGPAWVVRAGEPQAPLEGEDLPIEQHPMWFHRLYTFVMGTLLGALGVWVLVLIFARD